MILYHGSNVDIESIDLSRSSVGKDFGCGFYLKVFESYSKEWADFILANRKNDTRTQIHVFDIVHGPIANDDVGYQIRRLLAGLITIETFLNELKFKEGVTYQYFFATERSVQFLKKL